jgi:hypothetical protein
MDSKQRRQAKRKFSRENEKEMNDLIDWINGPDFFVMGGINKDGIIMMVPEYKKAFGDKYEYDKEYWKEYLIKHGVSPDSFKNRGNITEIAENI